MRWSNWAGDQVCAPAHYAEPRSEAELAEVVGRARTLRVAGSGHSFNDAACTDGTMVSLRRMDRVLDADASSGLARVEAGATLRAVGPSLAARGLAMENLGDVDAQGVAGALVTGTHGTGLRYGNIATQVEALRVVAADGGVHDVSADRDPDLFRAARVGFGAVGVVSEVTLRCRPLHRLRRTDEPRPLGQVLDSLDELVESRERFEFFAFPYGRMALTRTTETTDAPAAPPPRWRSFLEDVVLENAALGIACRLGRAMPSLVPRVDRAFDSLISGGVRVDLPHKVYANPRYVHFTEMEYAVPRAAGADCVRAVMDLVERRRLPITFPIEVRFVAGDDAFLSPAHERESCYVAVHQYRGMDFESYFRAVEAIMDAHGGRPHWGKRHYQTAASLRPRYPEWDRFAAVRDRVDPGRVFANDYTRRVLGG